MFSVGITAEDHWPFLTVFNKQTHDFQTDESRSPSNECCHEMNVSFLCCRMSPENMLGYATVFFDTCLTPLRTASGPPENF
jgi:hypothetical protein